MRILIIDDETEVAQVLASAVEDGGHQALVATGGREGLEFIAVHKPDAVFLDVRMPGLDGLAVLRSIRVTDPTLPVLVITGHAGEQEIEEAQRLGVTDVIEKPFILNSLTKAMATLRGQNGPAASVRSPSR